MLNIYEGALKIINPKLYKSPYKVNIFEVLNVIKNYKFRCRLIYLNNLLSLKIEEVPFEELQENTLFSGAVYETLENKIKLSTNNPFTKTADNINHELFHVSSTRKNINNGILLGGIGYSLTEGITEYFNLKSKNIKESKSGYQLELFVIEFLIFIYGEQILESYFLNNGRRFFEQFGDFKEDIVELEDSLEIASDNKDYQFYRLFYLCLIDRIPRVLPNDESFLKNLRLDSRTINIIKYHLNNKEEDISKDLKIKGDIDVLNYRYNNPIYQNINDEYVLEYNQLQRTNFKKILDILINIAIKKGLNSDVISIFIKNSFSFKNEEFKTLYEGVLESIEKKGKER